MQATAPMVEINAARCYRTPAIGEPLNARSRSNLAVSGTF